jgi:UMF1 family MFS transporter
MLPLTPKMKLRAWRGWYIYDWANSAFATVILAAVFPVYFASLVPEPGASLPGLSEPVPAAALWGYTVSGSLLLIALLAPWLGAMADRKGWQFRILAGAATLGAVATTLLFIPVAGQYLLAAGLFILANLGFAGGNIFYNAYLPYLATRDEMDRLSARGFAWGYIGGGVALLLSFLLIKFHTALGIDTVSLASRWGFLITGLWWGLFAVYTFWALPQIPPTPGTSSTSPLQDYLKTYRDLRRHPQLLKFLLAFLCYNDGIQTIIVVSALFGSEELGMSQGTILLCFLMIQFLAMPGTLVCEKLAGHFGARRGIQITLVIFIGITFYAFIMRHSWEFWLLAVLVSLVLGGSQALSRSLFASLVPRERSAEFFGFYAISAKFASILGPFIFALIRHLTGSTRNGILALAAFFVIGLLLLAEPKNNRRTNPDTFSPIDT